MNLPEVLERAAHGDRSNLTDRERDVLVKKGLVKLHKDGLAYLTARGARMLYPRPRRKSR